MAKVLLICGKICCGKTSYARRLRAGRRAVVLSVDEIMLSVFGLYTGEDHDKYAERIRRCLLEKSVEIVNAGVDVILDWGFWTKAARAGARAYFQSRSIDCELHYMDISEETWNLRVRQRNQSVSAGETTAYIVDENLAAKCEALFEKPCEEEIDVWVKQ